MKRVVSSWLTGANAIANNRCFAPIERFHEVTA